MAIAPASKGDTSLSQAFLNNKPVQAPTLPTITQPQARPLPQVPSQSTPAPQPTTSIAPHSKGGPMGELVDRIYEASGMPRRQIIGYRIGDNVHDRRPIYGPPITPVQQQTQPAPLPQSALLARAINERAQRGG